MKKLATLCLALILSATTYAQWGKKIKGNGNEVTIDRKTESYDAIAISGFFDIVLTDGTEGRLTLIGEENLLEHIKTEVKDGKLAIKVEKGYQLKPSLRKSIVVNIPVEQISAVALSGSGDITSETMLKSDTFKASISGSGDIKLSIEASSVNTAIAGSGDIKLSGKTTDLNISVSGSGDVHAYELKAENVKASVSGSADILVTSNNSITARVSGSGDIRYKGNATKINSKTSGSGSISRG